VTFVFLYIRADYIGRRFSQGCDQRALAPMTSPKGGVEICSPSRNLDGYSVLNNPVETTRAAEKPGIITTLDSLVQRAQLSLI
jgi:hypothetical protein